MRSIFFLAGPMAVLLAFAGHAPGAEPVGQKNYAIKFERPATAGKIFNFTAAESVRTHQKIEVPGGETTTNDTIKRVYLEAEVRTDKLDDKGREAQQTLIINTF